MQTYIFRGSVHVAITYTKSFDAQCSIVHGVEMFGKGARIVLYKHPDGCYKDYWLIANYVGRFNLKDKDCLPRIHNEEVQNLISSGYLGLI